MIEGNAADPQVLALGNLAGARRLFVTVPEAFEAGQVVEQARALNPGLEIVARAHSDATVEHLSRLGANLTVMGEREIARRMLEAALPEDSALAAAEQAIATHNAAANWNRSLLENAARPSGVSRMV